MAGFDVGAYVPRVLLARGPDAPRHWSSEGTLVFIDISGFTKLSDQLARRGREGAEDLISTLVRIFTLLLSASDDGGDVIKFGGDAMAIHYTGPHHVQRACHAAAMAQRILRVAGNVQLTGARARLKMSVGVHTGRFEFLLPGADHQDLVIAGADVTRTLELEGVADAGEILVSPEVADAMPPTSRGAAKGPGFLLQRAPTVPSMGSQILFRASDEEQVWKHLPTVFRERPDLLAAGSDHRRAAMAFVQVTGLDALVRSSPEDTLARLDALAEVVADAAAETGISVLDTDVSKDGFKYFLAAGAPSAMEDAEGRMLRALLKITRADTGLEVRAGCAAGQVFAGTVGAPFRCTYAAMGDTTNLAARLCGKAGLGEVIAHEPLLRRSLTEFAHDDPVHVELKGKPEPVPVARVTEVLGQRGRSRVGLPFVGRSEELLAIGEAFAGLAQGRGAVVELIGEAGLGKSTLAELAIKRTGLPVLSLTADPYGALVPFQSLRLLVRPLLGIEPETDPAKGGRRLAEHVQQHLPGVVPFLPLVAAAVGVEVPASPMLEDLDPRFRSSVLQRCVSELIESLLPDPVALVIDDSQWVDESSAEVLAAALAGAGSHPWAVVLTRREGEDGLHGSDELVTLAIRLEPLGEDEASALLSEQSAGLRPDEVHAIVGRGGGNPYFLLQMAQADIDGALPDSIEELVAARIDDLDAADRELLRDAAVLGGRFHADLYVAATGDADFRTMAVSPPLAQFMDLADDGTVTFQREIYREVAYGQLSFRKRRQLHHHVASAIERDSRLAGDAQLPMLSLHYHAAGIWERAYRTSLAAGDAAKAAWANEEAVVFFRRALDAGQRISAPAHHLRSLNESVGDVLQVAGRFDDATTAYRRAMRGETDPANLVRVGLKSGRVLDQAGLFKQAERVYRTARRTALRLEPDERAVVGAEIDLAESASRYYSGNSELARDLAARAWTTAESLGPDDRAQRVRARAAFLHDSAASIVDGPGGIRFHDLPLRIYEELGDVYYAGITCNNLGTHAFNEGRWTEAIELYRKGHDLCLRAGDRMTATFNNINLAEALGARGELDEAEGLLRDSLKTFRSMRIPIGITAALSMLAAVLIHRGELEEARAAIDEAHEVSEALDSHYDLGECAVLRLELMLAAGELAAVPGAAAALLETSLGSLQEARVRRHLGTALAGLGQTDPAREALEQSVAIARRMGSDHDVALTLQRMARLDLPDAPAWAAEAEAILTRLGVPFDPLASTPGGAHFGGSGQ